MKTGLGLNFLRIVNEDGFDGWAQVYARIPLNEEELKQKGALFGVIKSKNDAVPRELEEEIMMRVDKDFNELEEPGDLLKIVEGLESFNYVWVWVYENALGQREMRLIKNKGGVWVRRGRERIDLGVRLEDGRVIKGKVSEGDRLLMWAGEMQEMMDKYDEEKGKSQIEEMVDELVSGGRAGAALILKMEEWEEKGESAKKETKDEVIEAKEKEVIEEKEEVEMPINLEVSKVYWQADEPVSQEEEVRREVVSDSYVGKVGPKEKLINWWRRRKGGRQDLGVGRESLQRKKWAGWVGVVFLILLVVSVGAGTVKIKTDREQKSWSDFYEPLEKKRQEAKGLVDLNIVGARKLMEEVKMDFASRKPKFEKTRFKSELTDMEKKIEETWLLASGEKPVAINTMLNVALVREGFEGQRLGRLKTSNFLVLDGQMGVVVMADGVSKEIKVAAGKGQGWLDVVFDGKQNVILDDTGLVGGDGGRLVTFDSVVTKAVALGVFGSNVYVLDQGNKEIYKYVDGDSGFSERVRWLKEGQSMTAEPVDLAMDSDIWVLEKGNLIERFRRGSKENFSLNGVPENMSFAKVAVEADGERIALLEPDKGMVVVFKKTDGSFVEQLKVGTEKRLTDVEFDEVGGLWVLVGGVVGKVK